MIISSQHALENMSYAMGAIRNGDVSRALLIECKTEAQSYSAHPDRDVRKAAQGYSEAIETALQVTPAKRYRIR